MMKIYYRLLGSHYHCRVFFNGKSGDLCVGQHEWAAFRRSFAASVSWIDETIDPLRDH